MLRRTKPIEIEFARPDDAREIGSLSKKLIEYGLPGWSYTPERVLRCINDRTINVVVARKGRKIVGFGIMSYAEEKANLNLLGVKKRFRRKGIARRIVTWLEEVAKTAGIFNLYVQVREENAGAVAFYDSLGYEVIDIVDGYYLGLETALILYRDTSPVAGVT